MAFTEAGSEGLSSGTMIATMVAAPAANIRRIVRTLTVCNSDTTGHLVTVSKLKGATEYPLVFEYLLNPGDTYSFGAGSEICILDATDETIGMKLDGAAATNEIAWTAAFADSSD